MMIHTTRRLTRRLTTSLHHQQHHHNCTTSTTTALRFQSTTNNNNNNNHSNNKQTCQFVVEAEQAEELRMNLNNIKQQQQGLNKLPNNHHSSKASSTSTNSTTKASLKPEVINQMTDGQIFNLLDQNQLPHYELENILSNKSRAVRIRRMFFASKISSSSSNSSSSNSSTTTTTTTDVMKNLPFENYDYDQVYGVCCENVIGYVPIPVGAVGPVVVDGKSYMVPMATTEGCLVASTHRGAKALSQALEGGIVSVLLRDGMTRGPAIDMPNVFRANELKQWLETPEHFATVKAAFDSTSRFGRLQEIKIGIAGRKVFLRFKCKTGDAMGMNMISKAVTRALQEINIYFEDMKLLGLSGNYCTDKKPSGMNWIDGRGKSVVCEATVPKNVVEKFLLKGRATVNDLVQLNISKNLVGSAMAGSIGGNNAHASNIVTAIYIACGQDPAQNVESSNCMTLLEETENGDLYMSCTMPSIEVGTVGGGTNLAAQSACLEMLGVKGSCDVPGQNAQTLARIVCATVMAGELSLMSAIATNDLLGSHLRLNRAKTH